jgi:hypothetical protein
MIEGPVSVPLTNGSGSRRPKNIPTDPDPQLCIGQYLKVLKLLLTYTVDNRKNESLQVFQMQHVLEFSYYSLLCCVPGCCTPLMTLCGT